MNLRGPAQAIGEVLLYLIGGLLLVSVALRFIHYLPIGTSRLVEFAGGHFVLAVPNNWIIGYDEEPPHALILAHQRLPVSARLTLSHRSTSPESTAVAVLRSYGLKSVEDLGGGKAAASASGADRPGGGPLDAVHHVTKVDDRGHLLYLRAYVEVEPGGEWLPSVRADANFLHDAVRLAALKGDSELARKEYDHWAPARQSLKEIEEDATLSYNVLWWGALTFVSVWVVSHLVLERWFKLGKIGYTWVGQVTTLISFFGLLLAAGALFASRMEHKGKLAESVTIQLATVAVFHLRQQADVCPEDYQVSINVDPLIETSEQVQLDCNVFRTVMLRLAQHIAYARTQIVKEGDFVDPNWTLGLPISMYIGQGDRIIGSANLSSKQHEALSNRYMFFMEPLEQSLRIVQKQVDALATARALRNVSSLWSIFLAASLALGMVKLSGDRRIEREKAAREAHEAGKLLTVGGSGQEMRVVGQEDEGRELDT